MVRVGLISDTHGLLRPEAVAALQGVDQIIHAGDIGAAAIIEALAAIAPVTAIRGNNDTADWARAFPDTVDLVVGGCRIHVLHDLKQLAIDPVREGVQVVVSGHSHKPLVDRRDGVLYVNPGSAGRRRFSLPVSVGELRIADGDAQARLVELDVAAPRA